MRPTVRRPRRTADTCALAADQSESLSVIGMLARLVPCRLCACAPEAAPEDLIAFTRERLAHFKAPHGVAFVAELPKTATGKIQKYVLRKGAPAIAPQ